MGFCFSKNMEDDNITQLRSISIDSTDQIDELLNRKRIIKDKLDKLYQDYRMNMMNASSDWEVNKHKSILETLSKYFQDEMEELDQKIADSSVHKIVKCQICLEDKEEYHTSTNDNYTVCVKCIVDTILELKARQNWQEKIKK